MLLVAYSRLAIDVGGDAFRALTGSAAQIVLCIGLVLPPGNLKPSARFVGFEDSARKVTITMNPDRVLDGDAVGQSEMGRQ